MESTKNERSIDSTRKGALSDPFLRKEARSLWKDAARKKNLTAASCAAFHILLGGKLDKAFSPVTNPKKIANGAYPARAMDEALKSIRVLKLDAFSPWKPMLKEFLGKSMIFLDEKSKNHPLVKAATENARV